MFSATTVELLSLLGLPPDATTEQVVRRLETLVATEENPLKRRRLREAGRELLIRLANLPCPTCQALGTIPDPVKGSVRCPDCAGTRIKPR